MTAATVKDLGRKGLRATALVIAVTASTALTGYLIGGAAHRVAGNRMAPWILGRAAGICSYLLLVALVLTGLVLSHPHRARLRYPNATARIRLHIALAAFTLVFTVLHIVVLATDKYAGVGWAGAFLPMHAAYRPVATTLGIVALWAGLAAGITAALAGRLPRRLWWPIHKIAALSLVLVWVHGVLAGGDTAALLVMYLATGALVVFAAGSRYMSRTPADRLAELNR